MNIQLTNVRIFIGFCIVGIINTTLNYLVFLSLFLLLSLDYRISGICGFCIGALISFTLNQRFTFKNQDFLISQVGKFIATQFFCLILHTGTLTFSVVLFEVEPTAGQLFGLILTMIANFLLQKLWVFSK